MSTVETQNYALTKPGAPFDSASTTLLEIIRALAPNMQALRGQMLVIGVPARTILSDDVVALSEAMAFLRSLDAHLIVVYGEDETTELFEVTHRLAPLPRERMALVLARDAQVRHALESSLVKQHSLTGTKGKAQIASGNLYEARPAGVVKGIDLEAKGVVHFVNRAELALAVSRGNIVLLSTVGYSSTGDAHVVTLLDLMRSLSDAVGAQRRLIVLPSCRDACDSAGPTYPKGAAAPSTGIEFVEAKGDASLMNVLLAAHPPLEVWGRLSGLSIRPAVVSDIAAIVELIDAQAADGTMLRKDQRQVLQQLNGYFVAEDAGSVVGCASLVVYTRQRTGEMGSFAVSPSSRGAGVGDKLLEAVLAAARANALGSVFALTTRTEQWFRRRGFAEMTPDWLPLDRLACYDWSRRSKVFCKALR